MRARSNALQLAILWQAYHGCRGSDPMLLSSSPYTSRRHSSQLDLNIRSEGTSAYGRRNPNDPPIDYGGSHPFEVLEEKRRKLEGSTMYWYDPKFSVDDYIDKNWYDMDDTYNPEIDPFRSTLPEIELEEKLNWDKFRPIRIRYDTRYLDESSPDRVKDELIKYHVLPAAVQFWTKALMVYPVKRLFISGSCSLARASHETYGINNADLMIYISADKYCETPGSGSDFSIAGADSCDWDQYDRPIGGIVDFCYTSFDMGGNAMRPLEETKQMLIEVAIHEMGHILGLRSKDLAFYYDRLTGLPRTPGPKIPDPNIECINGKKASDMNKEVYRPSESTLKFGAIYPGIKYYEVVTPTVRRVARNHFNCPNMRGLRLENQPTSGDCFGDHWEERLAWDSSMSGTLTPGSIPEFLSPFTLALLQDSGWYKANFTMSRNPSFGFGAGCQFVEKPCVVDGVPTSPQFCNTTDKVTVKCDPTHRMMASCNLYDLSKKSGQAYPPVPQVYRYFNNSALGPLKGREVDWCPMFSEPVFSCTKSFSQAHEEESFGQDSRCFNSNDRPMCFDTYCSQELNAMLVRVGNETVKCEFDGQKINATFAGEDIYFECPQFRTVCPDLICPSGCSGSGYCDWNLKIPKCVFNASEEEEEVTSSGAYFSALPSFMTVLFCVFLGLTAALPE